MGGDQAPDAILAGCLDAVDMFTSDDQLVLVGDARVISQALEQRGLDSDGRIDVVPTTEVIGMAESPVTALRSKTDSSIVQLARLGGKKHCGDRYCDVIISAGNTGACVASAQMAMRRLPGVTRPGIAVTMPTFHGPVIVCDVGANPEPRPHHLHQYGHMASIYAQKIIGVDTPRVALLSIGGEEGKGNTLVRETHLLCKNDASLNYIGYVEGRDLFGGKADVVVTGGFTGNVVIKLSEGLAAGLFKTIAAEIMKIDIQLAKQFEPVVKSIYKKHDYHEYGGAPLLGANGICMICHGASEARTITAAIKNAIKYTQLQINQGIVEALARVTQTAQA